MLFNEIYSIYFNTVAAILREAVKGGITTARQIEIINEKAFSESVLTILPALHKEEWLLLNCEGKTPIKKPPQTSLDILQKRWLKALTTDPRIALFAPDISGLACVVPLFRAEDFVYFDRYADGDPFTDENYIRNFRTILKALQERRKLKICYGNRYGKEITDDFIPYRLEYSGKDDKFRLITAGGRNSIINLSRITRCEPLHAYDGSEAVLKVAREAFLTFDLTDERNALERALLHFSDCRKETRRSCDMRYTVTLWYNPQDEMEMLIRVLSFGQVIKVTAPESFIELIRKRVVKQKRLLK